jgi:hypothetical protein
VEAPKANSLCERFGGTLRRECLDLLIPFNERHLNFVLKTRIAHFNHARPHLLRRRALIAIVFLRVTWFGALLFSADSTMSIGLKKWRREPRMDFLRSTGDNRADHKSAVTLCNDSAATLVGTANG